MKKVLSYLLVLMLLIQIVPFSGYAAASAGLPVEQPSIYIDTDTYCRSGKTLTVDVCINNNPGFISTDFTVDFDSALTLIGATNGEAFASITDAQTGAEIEGLTYVPPAALNANGQIDSACHFLWYANTIDDRNIKNGTIVTLVFKVEDDVNAYDKLDISVQSLSSNNIDKTRATYDLVTNTVITVLDYMPGDVNNDGRLNVFDIVPLAQYISDGCKTIPESYNAIVNEKAADVTGDGRINVFDLVFLSQYIADGCQTRKDSYDVKLTFCDPKCEHTGMAATDAKAAECTVDGNIAYWYCADCAKYFSNAEATNEIAYIDTVISATGHTMVVDEAVAPSYTQTGLTEGSHCGVCGEVIMAQETVPMLQATYHAIIYRNLQGAESPVITQFAEHEGIAFEDVPDPVRSGYKFLGWYTKSEGGTKVDTIEVGTTTNVTVYADWEAISYTITYENAAVHSNADDTYTIEDEIMLKDAEWSGLVFSHWSDENGNEISKIDKGTIGNKVITANWISEKNLAIPSSNNKAQHIIYDDELNRYYFIYETGRIENVVISSLGTDDKNAGEELKWILSDTVTVENNIADTVARTVSNSFQQTDEWSENYEWIVSESASISSTITAGLEVEEFGVKAKIEAAIGAEESTETTNSRGYGKAGSITGGMESSDAISSTVSYTKGISTTITKEVTIPGNMPKGKYSYVCAGTVRVYAILTYDAATQNYYFDTYSVLDDELYEKRMYEAPANTTANIQSSEGLAFTFDTEEIKNLIDSVYYVQYDANGGEGLMLSSAFRVSENGSLLPNEFERNGYVFAGWSTTPDGNVVYCDNATVAGIAQSKEVVRLYAVWEVDPYSIGQYVATGSVVSDSDNSDSYTVYNTIASTPVSTTGRVIVDWRNDADTNLLNYPEKGTNGRLDISNSTTEILFIGSTGKTYSNLCLQLNDFEDDQTLVLRFMNFNFESNAATAICTNNGSAVNLTIDVIGSSSIKSTKASGSVLGTEAKPIEKLHFVGTGVMQLIAGDGATVTAAGMSGNDGGVAVYAKNIVFDMDSDAKLHIYGGNGSDGVRGADGADGTTNDSTTFVRYVDSNMSWLWGHIQEIWCYNKANAGRDGGTGGNGGNGGMPVVCETLVANTAGLTLVYGDGGNGGVGGSGGDGGRGHDYYGWKQDVSYLVCYDPGVGGDAGDGGDGGDAGHSVVQTYNFDNVEIIAGMDGIAGGGGTPGLKGIGGNGGETSGPANYYSAVKAADGLDGDVGAAGNP